MNVWLWVDENKRIHKDLPVDRTRSKWPGQVTIPLTNRKQLLDKLGVLEIPFGQEEAEACKSPFFFRTIQQATAYDANVLKSLREKRLHEISKLSKGNSDTGKSPERNTVKDGTKANFEVNKGGTKTSDLASEEIEDGMGFEIDPKKEMDFFSLKGAVVTASVAQRAAIRESGNSAKNLYYKDGRPLTLCRISHCFGKHCFARMNYLCSRHFRTIEPAYGCESLSTKRPTEESVANHVTTSKGVKTGRHNAHSCSYCNKECETYEEALVHMKDCGAVQEATRLPVPTDSPSRSAWTGVPVPRHLTGEARVLAEDYRLMVWKVIQDYKEKHGSHKNEHIGAALGQIPLEPTNKRYIPLVKYPTEKDEWESVRLFQRCGGPLAATLPGREKLIDKSNALYGDGRSVQLCRVAGCQQSFSKSVNTRFLCDSHYNMVRYVKKRKREDGNEDPVKAGTLEAIKAVALVKRRITLRPHMPVYT
ncbi:hypothetical protein ACHAWF_006368 [Thalassiosira exigua]